MSLQDARTEERTELFGAIVDRLRADSRIVGAWHFGSLGRGTSDFLSDIDLVSIVEDEAFDEIVAERYEFVGQFGEMVLTIEQPMNGPAGGIYLMSGYDCPTGLQLVDWYWQPRSFASYASRSDESGRLHDGADIRRNEDSERRASLRLHDGTDIRRNPDPIIFLREEMPEEPAKTGGPVITWHATPETDPPNVAALAWAMIAIQAKYVYRKPGDVPFDFIGFIASLVEKATSMAIVTADDPLPQMERFKRLRIMAEALEAGCLRYSRPAKSVYHLLDGVEFASLPL